MIKPLKYQKGGKAESQEQLVQLFQAAAENAQVDPQELVQKASELGQNEEAAAQFMQGLQLCAQGDPEGIKFIKSLFQSPAFKKGGKIFEFICKHGRGGYVAGCGCAQKAQDGALLGRPELRHIGEIVQQDANWQNKYNIQSNLYDYFGNKWVPTREGAFRQGLEAGAAYNDEGEKVYSPSAWANLRRFHEETLPSSNRVEAPEGKLVGMQNGGQVDPEYKGRVSHGEDDYSSYETVGPLHRVIRAAYDSPTQLDTIIYAKGDRGYTSPYSRSDYWMDQAGIQQVDAKRWKRLNQGFDNAKNAELDDLMNQAGFAKIPEKPQNQVRRGATPPGWKGSR